MRRSYDDRALESRFLTIEMEPGRPTGIPINLPEAQKGDALALRNKLLSYRLLTPEPGCRYQTCRTLPCAAFFLAMPSLLPRPPSSRVPFSWLAPFSWPLPSAAVDVPPLRPSSATFV